MTDPNDNDDKLAGIDLGAWEPPPPAGGPNELADAVIARVRHEPARAVPLDSVMRGPRRWWLIGGAAAALVAVAGATVFFGFTRGPANGRGEVVTVRPGHLDLGPSSAVLERDTEVRWERDKHQLRVVQPRGIATWRVADDDSLVIDAGAPMGGASVEAKGASLRVEVHMNLSDVRTVGASAVTAAAVAMLTVIVYEGHVKVSSSGQTVHVAPGTTVEVLPGQPPREVTHLADDQRRIEQLKQEIERRQQQLDELDAVLDQIPAGRVDPQPTATVQSCDEVSCVLNNYEGPCCQKYKSQAPPPTPDPNLPDSVNRAIISAGVAKVKGQVMACADAAFSGDIKVSVRVKPDGNVDRATLKSGDPTVGACVVRAMETAKFAQTAFGGSFAYPFRFTTIVTVGRCDADKLTEAGQVAFTAGNWSQALWTFSKSYACEARTDTAVRAFVAACNLKNVDPAKKWYALMSPTAQQQMKGICFRNGITEDQLQPPAATRCDADQLKEAAQGSFTSFNYNEALKLFEESYACRANADTAMRAFITACNLKTLAPAKKWYAVMSTSMRQQTKIICVRNGISEDQLQPSAAAQCDADQLKESAQTAFTSGNYAGALKQFEESYACRANADTAMRAFISACNLKKLGPAKKWFTVLSPQMQNQTAVICIRNGISEDQLGIVPDVPALGRVFVSSTPAAEILVDGKVTNETTPYELELAPGKHRITFLVGVDRYTFPVTVEPGKTVTLHKDLKKP